MTPVVERNIVSTEMAGVVARELKQSRAFASREQEVVLGLQLVTARIMEPWEKFLKATAELTLHP